MKITLSFENSISNDVSIMVDALRASTTITIALEKFEKIIPCFTPEEALKIKKEQGGILSGERGGAKLEGFDVGNSPLLMKEIESNEKTLILTTSNGTRILENMNATVLIGSMINARSTAEKSIKIAKNHIDIVMAGFQGEFTLEDFLASGEIIYWICKNLKEYEISEYAKAAVLASRDETKLEKAFLNSKSGKRLQKLNYAEDVKFCSNKNISKNVAIYNNNEIKIIKD